MSRRIRTSEKVQERAKELRRGMTPAERRLWLHLRDRRLGGFKFRRQHPLGPFIADFYCAECRLVVEIDGPIHVQSVEQDTARTAQFADFGYHVIRFTNDQVENDLPAVLQAILEAAILNLGQKVSLSVAKRPSFCRNRKKFRLCVAENTSNLELLPTAHFP